MQISEDFKDACVLFRSGEITLDQLFMGMTPEDFKLVGYTSDEEIKVKMLAPTKL